MYMNIDLLSFDPVRNVLMETFKIIIRNWSKLPKKIIHGCLNF